MPFSRKSYLKKKPSYYKRKYRKRYGMRKWNVSPNWKKPTQFFSVVRWSVPDTGQYVNCTQGPNPGDPITQDWPVAGGNYLMRFIDKVYTLDDMPNWQEFARIFNWYSIVGVKTCVTFTWSNTTSDQFEGIPPNNPADPLSVRRFVSSQDFKVCSFIDKTNRIEWETNDPVTDQATESNAKQNISYREHLKYNKNFSRIIHPKPLGVCQLTEVEDPVNIGLGSQNVQKWKGTQHPNIPHYGFVTGIRPVFTQTFQVPVKWRVGYSIDTQYFVQFKGLR